MKSIGNSLKYKGMSTKQWYSAGLTCKILYDNIKQTVQKIRKFKVQ